MSKLSKSLTDKQKDIIEIWYLVASDDIPTLIHCIGKLALITRLDDSYHLNPNEAQALLTLSDLLHHLETLKA